jgi:hypothetical protein
MRGAGEKSKGQGRKGREMTQTLYEHMNKRKKYEFNMQHDLSLLLH